MPQKVFAVRLQCRGAVLRPHTAFCDSASADAAGRESSFGNVPERIRHFESVRCIYICTGSRREAKQWRPVQGTDAQSFFFQTQISIFGTPRLMPCTVSFTFKVNSMFSLQSVFMCFVWISEQTAIISLYNIN